MSLTGWERSTDFGPGQGGGRRVAPALLLALGLIVLPSGPSAVAQGQKSRAPTIVHKSRNFRIPFNIEPEDRPLLREVQLWSSEDQGYHWKRSSVTTPERPAFTFRASRDGEYWFAVRTLDKKGQLFPSQDKQVEPSMKVVVDTSPPSLVIEPDGRRGSQTTVRWEVRDDHLDLKSLRLEYQVAGGRDWRQVPIRRASMIGSETWDAGTVEPLKVRGSIADKAGNVAEAELNVAEGLPATTGLAPTESPDFATPSSISQTSSGSLLPPPVDGLAKRPSGSEAPGAAVDDPFNFLDTASAPTPTAPVTLPPALPSGNDSDLFAGAAPASAAPAAAPTPAAAPAGDGATIVVGNPRFPMRYSVEDAGPSGPASVELWVTPDGGRTWLRRGEDHDKVSPILVDLGGEGTFGLRTVARAASGLGDQPPVTGDPPHVWVEVDTTPPDVKMNVPVVGTGANAGKVLITWHTSDAHLGPKPVQVSWRPDVAGGRWQPVTEPMENTGKFIWAVPADVPARFHLRVDAVDSVGNRNYAESVDSGPVIVDRTRPKSRIIGLDPSVRSGMGPNARPLR